jgi:hypothetical protein
MLRVLSLGAGVQSTTLALMAAHGEIEPPDVAIFADTGDEKRGTYRHIDWLGGRLPYPLERVRRFPITLAENTLARYAGIKGTKAFTPPFFYPGGMLPKQCSKEFKTRAITGMIRKRLGLAPRERGLKTMVVEVLIGISRDEAHRMKPSEVPWIKNVWPLIDLHMRRSDCEKWLLSHGYPIPPRSACVYCPFQDDGEFEDMKQNEDDDDWSRATLFDLAIRAGGGGTTGPLYVSEHRVALINAPLDRQRTMNFGSECGGVCGV